MALREAALRFGLDRNTFYKRLNEGMTEEEAILCPSRRILHLSEEEKSERFRRQRRTSDKKWRSSEQGRAWKESNRSRNREHQEKYRALHREECRRRSRDAQRRKREADPKGVSAKTLKWVRFRKYGLTEAAFQEMVERQRGLCAICGAVPMGAKGFCVDHDHATNEVRDLLCQQCNVGLGNFKDRPELLESALKYLRRWKSGGVR